MIRKLSFITIILAVMLSACQLAPKKEQPDWQDELANSPDPLSALQSAARTKLYDETYWSRVKAGQPDLWKYAAYFCKYHTEYPNCIPVNKFNTNPPKYNPILRFAEKSQPKKKQVKTKAKLNANTSSSESIATTKKLKRKAGATETRNKKKKSAKNVAKSGVKETPEN